MSIAGESAKSKYRTAVNRVDPRVTTGGDDFKGTNHPDGISKDSGIHCIRLQKVFYGFKQSGKLWYDRFRTYIIEHGYVNHLICPSLFVKRNGNHFSIF
ncbi:MAG TPA: hypothetical protein VEQ18_02315 [Candidatus Nitrosocosmicus sp.]|nr:hypothetical protein [Candidatus Nitrosocosmicus sp.]